MFILNSFLPGLLPTLATPTREWPLVFFPCLFRLSQKRLQRTLASGKLKNSEIAVHCGSQALITTLLASFLFNTTEAVVRKQGVGDLPQQNRYFIS